VGRTRPREEEASKMPKGKTNNGGGNPYHSAKDGKFVSQKYADKHPATTVKIGSKK
jgi:hypothetical protein